MERSSVEANFRLPLHPTHRGSIVYGSNSETLFCVWGGSALNTWGLDVNLLPRRSAAFTSDRFCRGCQVEVRVRCLSGHHRFPKGSNSLQTKGYNSVTPHRWVPDRVNGSVDPCRAWICWPWLCACLPLFILNRRHVAYVILTNSLICALIELKSDILDLNKTITITFNNSQSG